MPEPTPHPIAQFLSDENLEKLQAAYRRAEFYDAMKNPLLQVYDHLKAYADAVERNFYYREDPNNPNDDNFASPDPGLLTVRERELCLITLLTAQDQKYNLALHVYMALMEGITPTAVLNATFLAAVYAGLPFLAGGLDTAIKTMLSLQQWASTPGSDLRAAAIYKSLRDRFDPPPRPAPGPG